MQTPPLENIIRKAVETWVKHQLFSLETGDIRHHNEDFANFCFDAHLWFRSNKIGQNEFINERTVFSFSRQFNSLCYETADVVVNAIQRDKLSSQLETLQQELRSSWPPRLPAGATREEIYETDRQRREVSQTATALHGEIRKETEVEVMRLFLLYFNRFTELFTACQSPLEQAFLIGMFAYSNNLIKLLDPVDNSFKAQHPVEGYYLDFAYVGAKVDGAEDESGEAKKIAIELDGHTYHERTEEQAVHDRHRDRVLQQAGWKVFRFHRREIETNLEGCVNEVLKAL